MPGRAGRRARAGTNGAGGRYGTTAVTAGHRQRPVQVGEEHTAGSAGTPGPRTAPDRSAAPGRARAAPGRGVPDTAARPAGAPAPGGAEVDETHRLERRRTHRAEAEGGAPGGRLDEVHEDVGSRPRCSRRGITGGRTRIAGEFPRLRRGRGGRQLPLYAELSAAVADDDRVLRLPAGPAEGQAAADAALRRDRRSSDGPPAGPDQLRATDPGRRGTGSARRCSPRFTQTNEPARCAALRHGSRRHRRAGRPGRGRVVGRPLPLYRSLQLRVPTAVRGPAHPRSPDHVHDQPVPVPDRLPQVAARVGIDQNPLDPAESGRPGVAAGAGVARAEPRGPARTARRGGPASQPREPATVLTGDLVDRLPEALDLLPAGCSTGGLTHRRARVPGAGSP